MTKNQLNTLINIARCMLIIDRNSNAMLLVTDNCSDDMSSEEIMGLVKAIKGEEKRGEDK